MPWITKDSGTINIDRRDEPYLNDTLVAEIRDKYLPRYERKAGALLPALHLVQHQYGWIPHQAMVEIAKLLDMAPADVIDTASFYEEYWLKPKGKHVVAVCRSIACEFCGQPELTDAVREHLGVDVGETTDDNEFTIIELECLGSCGTAPVMLVDHDLYENVKPEQVAEILTKAKAANAH
ncbi:MAG: NADH-quinone oxidoreductase subunit NuoE [Planctomycetota bacterium]|nr:NADH-quinone oxidoreductase subunit NuoE [Planctomycetota bacterium]